MVVADHQRLGAAAGALEPFQVELDHRDADDLAVGFHRLRDVVAGFVAGDADGVEAAHPAARGDLEVGAEAVVGADEAAGLAMVAGGQRDAVGGNHIRGRRMRAPVDLGQVLVGGGDARRVVGGFEQPAHEGVQRDQRGQEFVAVEGAFERGGVAVGTRGGALLQRGQAALERHQPGQPAQQQQARRQRDGKAPPPAAAGVRRMHRAGGGGIMHG
ncbi:hypothetical protein D9M69_481170 [compost metagenome]